MKRNVCLAALDKLKFLSLIANSIQSTTQSITCGAAAVVNNAPYSDFFDKSAYFDVNSLNKIVSEQDLTTTLNKNSWGLPMRAKSSKQRCPALCLNKTCWFQRQKYTKKFWPTFNDFHGTSKITRYNSNNWNEILAKPNSHQPLLTTKVKILCIAIVRPNQEELGWI